MLETFAEYLNEEGFARMRYLSSNYNPTLYPAITDAVAGIDQVTSVELIDQKILKSEMKTFSYLVAISKYFKISTTTLRSFEPTTVQSSVSSPTWSPGLRP